MAKITVEGAEIEESCECYKEMGEWYPYCSDTEYDININEIEFSDDEIEQLIQENAEKVAELLIRDKKFFAEVMRRMEKLTKRIASNGNSTILEFVKNKTTTKEV